MNPLLRRGKMTAGLKGASTWCVRLRTVTVALSLTRMTVLPVSARGRSAMLFRWPPTGAAYPSHAAGQCSPTKPCVATRPPGSHEMARGACCAVLCSLQRRRFLPLDEGPSCVLVAVVGGWPSLC